MSRLMRDTQTFVATHGGSGVDVEPGANRAALRRLYQYARPYRSTLVAAVVCIVVASALQIVLINQSQLILGAKPETVSGQGFAAQMRSAAAVLLTTGAVQVIFAFGQIFFAKKVALKTVRDLRDTMFGHLHTLELTFYDRSRSGELMSRLVNDTYMLQTALEVDIPALVAAPVLVGAALVSMLVLNWRVTLVAFIVVPPIAWTVTKLGKQLRKIVHAMQGKLGDLQTVLQESLSGIRVVKCFGMEQAERERFARDNQRFYREGMRAARVTAIFRPLGDYLGVVGFVGVLIVGMREITAQPPRLELSGLLVLAVLVQRIAASLNRAGHGVAMLNQAAAVCERAFELLDTKPENVDPPGAPELDPGDGYVRFEDVCFSYDGETEVLSGISFEIPPGRRVALVGPSGGGKTTVANLLPRLYVPTSGQVLVNGQDVGAVSAASVRRCIGVVLQDMFLFSGTVRDNILVARPGASDEEVVAAAEAANAHEFVQRLPHGYDTHVGERGATLSGGQRQRIAIARALLRDPRILILDEATSSLDSESEAVVQAALEVLMRERTSLVIAHRLSTISSADEILVLVGGRIVERGTHEQLIAAHGEYAALWRLQASAPDRGDAAEARDE